MTSIAIIGAGNVGGALAARWSGIGHAVVLGVRDPSSPKVGDLLAAVPGLAVAAPAEAAAGVEVVVLAVPGTAVDVVVSGLGELTGKILVDATNPIGVQLPAGVASGGEWVATLAPGARVVKAFNTTGSANMVDTSYGGGPAPLMPVAGDDPAAVDVVVGLSASIGFDTVAVGGLAESGCLEALAQLWIGLAYRQGLGPGIAFALVRR